MTFFIVSRPISTITTEDETFLVGVGKYQKEHRHRPERVVGQTFGREKDFVLCYCIHRLTFKIIKNDIPKLE